MKPHPAMYKDSRGEPGSFRRKGDLYGKINENIRRSKIWI